MPSLPRCAGAGLFQRMQPLVMAGTGYLDNTELNIPTGAGAITLAVRIDSNAILVAGLNSFMLATQCTGAFDVYVSHCDPFTDTIITTHQIANALIGGVNQITSFGAFGTSTGVTNTGGHVWHTLRIGLQGDVANVTLTNVRLWLGTR